MISGIFGNQIRQSREQSSGLSRALFFVIIKGLTHPAMTKLLQRLESKGFIQCVPSAKDRRYKKITCTEKSTGIYKMILAQDQEVLDEICKGFTKQEKEALLQTTDLILRNIDSQ